MQFIHVQFIYKKRINDVSMSALTIRKKILLIYCCWWIVWLVNQTLAIQQLGFDWTVALIDASITQLVLALSSYVIYASMQSYSPSGRNALYVLIWSIALATLTVLFQRWLLQQLLTDNTAYVTFLENSLVVRGAFAWLMIMLASVLTWSWVYVSDRQESEKRKQDSERLAREAELSNLRMQLQPHFLFNSLNSISALIGLDPERARTMIHQLSDFLRGTVRKDSALVSLEEELEHLNLYLEIEKVRFGHRLQTKITYSIESLSCKLPSLLLQPVVENAIKFGLYDTIGETIISIDAKIVNACLVIEIVNPFDEVTAQPKRGTSFGLSSIQRRLYLLYAQPDLVQTSQSNKIFTTNLKIPQSR